MVSSQPRGECDGEPVRALGVGAREELLLHLRGWHRRDEELAVFLIARVLVACESDPAEEVTGAAASPSVEDEASAVAPEPSPVALRARVDFVTSARPFLSLPPNLCDLAARVDADAAQRDRARIIVAPGVFRATTPIREALAALMLAPAALMRWCERTMRTKPPRACFSVPALDGAGSRCAGEHCAHRFGFRRG